LSQNTMTLQIVLGWYIPRLLLIVNATALFIYK